MRFFSEFLMTSDCGHWSLSKGCNLRAVAAMLQAEPGLANARDPLHSGRSLLPCMAGAFCYNVSWEYALEEVDDCSCRGGENKPGSTAFVVLILLLAFKADANERDQSGALPLEILLDNFRSKVLPGKELF